MCGYDKSTSYALRKINIVNITGNERADKAAKLAHSSNYSLTALDFSYQDVKRTIAKDIHDQWENKWVKLSSKLHEIKRTTYPCHFLENTSRKQETAITRLRIGYTHITHQHLMKREDPLICTSCGTSLTFQLILTKCRSFDKDRREADLPDQLSESLNPDPRNFQEILEFIYNPK